MRYAVYARGYGDDAQVPEPELGEEELSAAVDEAIEQARSVYEESDRNSS